METLKVSTKSNPNSVAGAMAGVVRSEGEVVVQVVGAGALNQAVKAIAIARGYVEAGGIDLVCVPTFAEVEIDGEPRTAIRLVVHDRRRPSPAVAAAPCAADQPAAAGRPGGTGPRPGRPAAPAPLPTGRPIPTGPPPIRPLGTAPTGRPPRSGPPAEPPRATA